MGRIKNSIEIEAPIEKVFAFYADGKNLEKKIKLKLLQHNLNRSNKGNVENYKTFFNHALKKEMFFLEQLSTS